MLALSIIVAVLLLLLILPLGVDFSYREKAFSLYAVLGPLRFRLLGRKRKQGASGAAPAAGKKKRRKKPAAAGGHRPPRRKPGLRDLPELGRLLLGILAKLRHHLCVDRLDLLYVCAAPDPCDAIVQYGRANAVFSALLPLLSRAFRILDRQILVDLDLQTDRPRLEAHITVTVQLWEVFYLGFFALWGFLRWYLPFRKAGKGQDRAEETAPADLTEQKG